MTTCYAAGPAPSGPPGLFTGRLRLAVSACLARFKGSSPEPTETGLRCCLAAALSRTRRQCVAAAIASGPALPGLSRRAAVVVQSTIVPAFGTTRIACIAA